MRFNASGTRSFHRSDFYLIGEGILTPQVFILFEFLVNQMGFDPEHEERFGVVEIESYQDLANFLGYSSENSVRSKIRKLVDTGLLVRAGRRSFLVAEHRRYLAQSQKWGGLAGDYMDREKGRSPKEVLQSIGVKMQYIGEKLQSVEEIKPSLPEKPATRYLSSSKVKSSITEHQLVRSLSEYQEFVASGQFPGLTVDDMQWIDGQKFPEIGAAIC